MKSDKWKGGHGHAEAPIFPLVDIFSRDWCHLLHFRILLYVGTANRDGLRPPKASKDNCDFEREAPAVDVGFGQFCARAGVGACGASHSRCRGKTSMSQTPNLAQALPRLSSGQEGQFYFLDPSPNHEDLLSTMEKALGTTEGNLKKLLGAEATKTNYAFHRAILEETPGRISLFTPQRNAIRSSMLLVVKAISSVGGETGLFEVQSSGWRGFQFDDPSKRPKRITLELYDNQDQHIEIIFSPGATEDAGLT